MVGIGVVSRTHERGFSRNIGPESQESLEFSFFGGIFNYFRKIIM
jgi:hypothetical protein